MGEVRNAYKNLARKHERVAKIRRFRNRQMNNIKIDIILC
jgi:hypothetical protein